MSITFTPLSRDHFPLLLTWLQTPHVRKWWDREVQWTPEMIEKKYGNYVQGFKRLELATGVIEKPIHAFIISVEYTDIGYIQYYNKHDFPSEHHYDMADLPQNIAAIDWYIGEEKYTGRGIGTKVLTLFLKVVFKDFNAVFADPDSANMAAIRTYKKAGFVWIKTIEELEIVWMVKDRE